ncbi:unnamed protein product, partial [marine sediment metagenome]
VPANLTEIFDIKFLADFGLKVASLADANVAVTIFHSNEGS